MRYIYGKLGYFVKHYCFTNMLKKRYINIILRDNLEV